MRACEVGLTAVKLSHPVFHGDTLYAPPQRGAAEPTRNPAAYGRFRHYGVNQDRKLCVQAERTVMRRRPDPRRSAAA